MCIRDRVDMQAALTKKADSTAGDVRTLLRDKNIRHAGITRDGNAIVVRFRDQATLAAARPVLADQLTDFIWTEGQDGTDWKLAGSLKPDSIKRVQEAAITQNITTLHNRVNELGVAEPVIQQQGADRVVVQLPGVQDTAKAKDIIGRTATLEMRMVDDSLEARLAAIVDHAHLERRGAADDVLGLGRVLHAGQLDDDAVGALLLDHRLGDAELVDAVVQRRDVLRDRRRLDALGGVGLEVAGELPVGALLALDPVEVGQLVDQDRARRRQRR